MSASNLSGPIVVSGATGTTSGETIRALLRLNIPVRALVRNRTKAESLLAKNDLLEIYEIDDLTNLPALMKAYEGARGAWIISPGLADALRVESAQVQAARDAKVPQVVLLSSSFTTYPITNIIGETHSTCEKFLTIARLPSWTVLCPDSFHQNYLWQKYPINNYGMTSNLSGDSKIAAVDAFDIGSVAAQVFADGPVKHHGQRYILTCEEDQALTAAQQTEVLSKALGKPLVSKTMELEQWNEVMKSHMGEFELLAVGTSVLVQRNHFRAYTDIRKVLGRAPKSFQEFVNDNVHLFRA